MDPISQLKANPRDIRYWQAALGEARKRGCQLFVRQSPIAKWVRVELVQAPNCVVWIVMEGTNITDENSFSFDPSKTTFPPYNLDTTGEVRFGSYKTDFQN